MSVMIAGSGSYVPRQKVSSEDIDKLHGFDKGYLKERTGVCSRYYCEEGSQIDMAAQASRLALEDAGIDASEVDLIISGCAIPYQTIPSTAPLLQRALGIKDGTAAAFDVNSTCLGFLSAFDYAAKMLIAEEAKTALVFSSEISSRALPWKDDPETASLFGDGAAAVVLVKSEQTKSYSYTMRTYPSAYEACQITAGGTRYDFAKDKEEFAAGAIFRMNGKELFKVTAFNFGRFLEEMLEKVGWQSDSVDLIIPHQASPHALSHMVKMTDFPSEKIVNIAADYGNQIAASIPTTLDIARREGRVRDGMRVLFLGTSAGVSFGAMTLEV